MWSHFFSIMYTVNISTCLQAVLFAELFYEMNKFYQIGRKPCIITLYYCLCYFSEILQIKRKTENFDSGGKHKRKNPFRKKVSESCCHLRKHSLTCVNNPIAKRAIRATSFAQSILCRQPSKQFLSRVIPAEKGTKRGCPAKHCHECIENGKQGGGRLLEG